MVDHLVGLAPKAIILSYTSSSYALGAEADARVHARLETRAKSIRMIFPCLAAASALCKVNARRICLVHPPWWSEAVSDQGSRSRRIRERTYAPHGSSRFHRWKRHARNRRDQCVGNATPEARDICEPNRDVGGVAHGRASQERQELRADLCVLTKEWS